MAKKAKKTNSNKDRDRDRNLSSYKFDTSQFIKLSGYSTSPSSSDKHPKSSKQAGRVQLNTK